MSDLIWGLARKNFEDALWNGLSHTAIFTIGAGAAIVANGISRAFFSNDDQGKPSDGKHLVCTWIGFGASAYACFRYADRLPCVTFAADKALKFLVLSLVTGGLGFQVGAVGGVISMATAGGVLGYFGPGLLCVSGALGAAYGSHLLTEKIKNKPPQQ
jgi:hypothetical protein